MDIAEKSDKDQRDRLNRHMKSYQIVDWQLRDVYNIYYKVLIKKNQQVNQKNDKNTISKMQYDLLMKKLENEQSEHERTKNLLLKESEKLEFALGEIDILNKQLQREKEAFERAFDDMRDRAEQELATADQFKNKCSEVTAICNRQEDSIGSKEMKIRDLKARLAKQREAHKLQLSEMSIKMQQEIYMARRSMQDAKKKTRNNKNSDQAITKNQ